MTVGHDQRDRHVGVEEALDQQAHRGGDEQALHNGHRAQRPHRAVFARADRLRAEDELQQRQRGGEPQGGKAGFGDHFSSVFVSCTAPTCFGGM